MYAHDIKERERQWRIENAHLFPKSIIDQWPDEDRKAAKLRMTDAIRRPPEGMRGPTTMGGQATI